MRETLVSPSALERARVSRDSRFDGRFFVGVKTTGIYCRPICPVRLPRSENVLFFPTAAAAQQDGYRPCLRCRPEVAPGSPAWRGTSAVVSRALRLISEGAMDCGNTDELATRLGVSGRHLRRLFQQHLGASPAAVARTRRVHFAKQLLDQTDLSISEIAFSSGFGSLRRFNSTIRELYGRSPSHLRTPTHGRDSALGEGLSLRLPYRSPFDWTAMLGFLSARAIPGVEHVDLTHETYARTVELESVAGRVEVRDCSEGNCLKLTILHPKTAAIHFIVERVRNLFDLFGDPHEINELLGRSPILMESVDRFPGLRLPGAWDPFEMTVRAVLGQQISVPAATTLAGRIVERFGKKFAKEGYLTHLFPAPKVLAEQSCQDLGMPRARAKTIQDLALAIVEEKLDFGAAPAEVRQQLGSIRGIGPWTIEYVGMRVLGDPDAFPSTDLGVIKAVRRLMLTQVDPASLAETWRPWRAYAVMHLWRSLAP